MPLLDTEDAVRSVKAQILDDRATVPQYDGVEAFSFRLTTIHDQMQAFQADQAGNDGQNVVSNIQSMVFPIIKMGQKALDVTWEGQAWGYGWATPTASFSIKWNPRNATFSVSISGVGSAGRGSGIHSII